MEISELYSIFKKHPVICTNSRAVTHGCIFFALKGPSFNGNIFAEEALKQGAAYAVVDEKVFAKADQYILTENTLTTLQLLAHYHRRQLTCPVIAITGSNGKTTTKELIAAVLSKNFKTYFTKGNLNNHIGVPLTILSAAVDTQMLVVEMGANHLREIESLCSLAEPDHGIITNVGKAHLEGFGSFNGVMIAKGELYAFLAKHNGVAFVNADNHNLSEMLSHINRTVKKIVSYGTQNNAQCIGEVVEEFPFLKIKWSYKDVFSEALLNSKKQQSGMAETHLVGKYNFENVLAAITVGNYFGVKLQNINVAISEYVPSNNRSQLIQKGTNTILLDAYNANPTSVAAALENFASLGAQGKEKVIILGEMAELGEDSAKEHLAIVRLLSGLSFSRIILVGKLYAPEKLQKEFVMMESIEAAVALLNRLQLTNAFILVKGSRSTQMEKVLEAL